MNDTEVGAAEIDKLMNDDSLMRSENRKYNHKISRLAGRSACFERFILHFFVSKLGSYTNVCSFAPFSLSLSRAMTRQCSRLSFLCLSLVLCCWCSVSYTKSTRKWPPEKAAFWPIASLSKWWSRLPSSPWTEPVMAKWPRMNCTLVCCWFI